MSNKLDELQNRADEGKGAVIASVLTVAGTVLGFACKAAQIYLSLKGEKEMINKLNSENQALESSLGGLGRFVNASKIKENTAKIDEILKK